MQYGASIRARSHGLHQPSSCPGTAGTVERYVGRGNYHTGWLQGDTSLQWRHIRHDGVWNHQPQDCLLNRLFRRRSKKTSKLLVTGFVRGIHRWPVNSPHKGPVTRKMFPFDDVILYWTWKCHHFMKKIVTAEPEVVNMTTFIWDNDGSW